MLTKFGVILKKIRLENNNETIQDMGNKLNYTAAYISNIQLGRKNIPDNFIFRLESNYDISKYKKELIEAIKESKAQLKVNLFGLSKEDRHLIITFVSNYKELSTDKKNKIYEILER